MDDIICVEAKPARAKASAKLASGWGVSGRVVLMLGMVMSEADLHTCT